MLGNRGLSEAVLLTATLKGRDVAYELPYTGERCFLRRPVYRGEVSSKGGRIQGGAKADPYTGERVFLTGTRIGGR